MSWESRELKGLRVILDDLVYVQNAQSMPKGSPHAFVYFITIRNESKQTVTLLGRKWIIKYADGSTDVVEGDKIVGKTPILAPHEEFSYNSYHVTAVDAHVHGSFHGHDSDYNPFFVKIPVFELIIPKAGN